MTDQTAPAATAEQTEPTPGTNLLEVSTLAPTRFTITVKHKQHPDGKLYELIQVDELSLEQQAELGERGDQLEKVHQKGKRLTVPEARKLALVLDKMIEVIVLELPEEVRESMSEQSKILIVEAFMNASPDTRAALAKAKDRAAANAKQTGAN